MIILKLRSKIINKLFKIGIKLHLLVTSDIEHRWLGTQSFELQINWLWSILWTQDLINSSFKSEYTNFIREIYCQYLVLNS